MLDLLHTPPQRKAQFRAAFGTYLNDSRSGCSVLSGDARTVGLSLTGLAGGSSLGSSDGGALYATRAVHGGPRESTGTVLGLEPAPDAYRQRASRYQQYAEGAAAT